MVVAKTHTLTKVLNLEVLTNFLLFLSDREFLTDLFNITIEYGSGAGGAGGYGGSAGYSSGGYSGQQY